MSRLLFPFLTLHGWNAGMKDLQQTSWFTSDFGHYPTTWPHSLQKSSNKWPKFPKKKRSSWASHLDRHGWSWTPWRLVCDRLKIGQFPINLVPFSWSSKHVSKFKLSWETVSHIDHIESWAPPIPKLAWIFCLTSLQGRGTFTMKIHCFADHPRTTRRLCSGGERNGPGGVISHFMCLLTIQKLYGLTQIGHISGYLKTSMPLDTIQKHIERCNRLQTKYQKQWYETNTDTDTNLMFLTKQKTTNIEWLKVSQPMRLADTHEYTFVPLSATEPYVIYK